MKKIIVIGSFLVVFLILLSSFSSVAAYQTREESLKTRIHETANLIREGKYSSEIQEKIKNIFNNVDYKELSKLGGGHGNFSFGALFLTCFATIISEFYVYTSVILESHGMKPGIIIKLFLLSVVINVLTNPAVNLIFYFICDDSELLEDWVVIIETFMIFSLFNFLKIHLTELEAEELSKEANIYSFQFVHDMYIALEAIDE